jgi:hypothetical protein
MQVNAAGNGNGSNTSPVPSPTATEPPSAQQPASGVTAVNPTLNQLINNATTDNGTRR